MKWGSEKKASATVTAGAIDCLIGERMSVVGDVVFAGGLQVEGKLKGTLRAEAGAEAFLNLGSRGRIEGEVQAPQVVIDGELIGDVIAERLQLGSGARIQGNVYYKLLEMAAGAQINGQMVYQDEPRKQLPKLES